MQPIASERRYYLIATVGFFLLVFWTFARTFYLRPLFQMPPLSLRLHIHGAVMTGWVALLVVQSVLVAARRIKWHRWLGYFGAGWAVLVVIMGATTTVHAAARDLGNHSPDAFVKVMIMGLELVQMLLFAGFVTAAIVLRRRADYHKRFMLLTIPCMLPSALARLPVPDMSNMMILIGLQAAVFAMVGFDTIRTRRLHPAFGCGAVILLLAIDATFFGVQTHAWIGFASSLLT